MISKTSSRFWKCYKRLPEHIKKEAKIHISNLKRILITQVSVLNRYIPPGPFFLYAYPKIIALWV